MLHDGNALPPIVAFALERNCTGCRGEPLANGAPMRLASLVDLLLDTPGQPSVPRYAAMAERVACDDDQRMPPPPQPAIYEPERVALLEWAAAGGPPAPLVFGPDPARPIPEPVWMPQGMALPPAARAILEAWLGGEPSDCSTL